jgi:hypothetical protein
MRTIIGLVSVALVAALVVGCSASSTAAPPRPDVPHHVTLGVASFQPRGATFFGTNWRLDAGGEVYAPVAVDAGCTFTGWSVGVQKVASNTQLTAALQYAEPLTSVVLLVEGIELSALGQVGALKLSSPEIGHVVQPGVDYEIRVARDFTPGADFAMAAELTYTCPAP